MDEVVEEFKRLKYEERQKFIYAIHKSANSNCLNNPMTLAISIFGECIITIIKV